MAVGAAPLISVALPSFVAAGTQTFECTVDPTDTRIDSVPNGQRANVDSSDSTCYGATDSNARPRCFPAYEQVALRQWNIDDPVDASECARNDKVEAIQGKRNPFIDRPDFIEKIGSW